MNKVRIVCNCSLEIAGDAAGVMCSSLGPQWRRSELSAGHPADFLTRSGATFGS